jgi:hypothetical protein
MNEERRLFLEAVLGKQAEEWWNSDLGQYVVARSKAERDALINEMRECNEDQFGPLRGRWIVAEAALKWIDEAIQAGKQALAQLEEQ